MSISPNDIDQHTLHTFDVELNKLNGMLLGITELLAIQLELSLQALEKSNSLYAADSISLINDIRTIKSEFDFKVPVIIAKFWPVANDLRFVVSILKIADQLGKVSDEIACFAHFVDGSFSSPSKTLASPLLSHSIEIGRYVLSLLNALRATIDSDETDTSFNILESDRNSEKSLYNKLEYQLIQIVQDKMYDEVDKILPLISLLDVCPSEFRRIFACIISYRLADCRFRRKWIADAAYYLAEHRNFSPGFKLND